MRAIIILLLALAATVALMLQIRADSGYVLLSYGSYSLETSLVILTVALAIGFALFYVLIRSLITAVKLPAAARRFSHKRQRARAAQELQQGLLQLSEGHWAQAQKTLTRHASDSSVALVHYLNAARAAQHGHDTDSRDAWIAKAYVASPEAEVAIGLAKAELQIQAGQHVHALATLRRLREKNPKHPYVLRLLAGTHIELNEWQELEQLLGDIEQSKAFDKAGLENLRQRLWINRLEQITASALEGRREIAAEHLQALWKKTSRAEREDPSRLLYFAKAWHAAQQDQSAANIVEPLLKKNWNEQAAALYGWLDLEQKQALKSIEQWLKQHGDQPSLLLTAARVCIRYQLWGRARSWLNHLTTTHPSEAAWRELAALEELQGNANAAAHAWRAAATMSGQTVTPLLPQAAMKKESDDEIGHSSFRPPDVAGPECLSGSDSEDEATETAEEHQLRLPVTPADAYSNESKNS